MQALNFEAIVSVAQNVRIALAVVLTRGTPESSVMRNHTLQGIANGSF